MGAEGAREVLPLLEGPLAMTESWRSGNHLFISDAATDELPVL